MEAVHAHLLGNQHVIDLAPRLLCGHGVLVVEACQSGWRANRNGTWVTSDCTKTVSEPKATMNEMARRMTGRADCGDAGHQLLAPFIGAQSLHHLAREPSRDIQGRGLRSRAAKTERAGRLTVSLCLSII
jgi:hypothetical protein